MTSWMAYQKIPPGLIIILCLAGGLSSCARTVVPSRPEKMVVSSAEGHCVQEGMASWYGPGFHGRSTTSGEAYDMYRYTAAHPTLPMGTEVKVTNLENGRIVRVRINDRGPFVRDRILDLSYAAASELDMAESGTAKVRLEILNGQSERAPCALSMRPFYVLQLGSFAQKSNALALQANLEHLLGKEGVQVVPGRVGSREVFRVRVGRFDQWEDAQARAQELALLGYMVLVVEEYN